MRISGTLLVAAVCLAAPLHAQTTYNPIVVKAMAGRWVRAQCAAKGDFRSASAATYLAYTDTAKDEDRKQSLMKSAVRVTTEAIKAGFPTPGSWYYLGRADLMLGDVVGADTAMTKAATLAPDCDQELKGFRQIAWNALVLPTAELLSHKSYDSAVVDLRAANTISREYPQGFFNLAIAYVDLTQYDSAVTYFKLAQEKSTKEARFASTGDDATMNLALLYQQKGDHKDAITEFQKYIAVKPNDAAAKKSMATSMRLSGDTAGANQVTAALAASGDLSAGELMQEGIDAYKAQKYAEAVDFFTKVLDKEPGSHDALFNIANMYLALGNGPKLAEAAKACLAVSPLGQDDLKLLAQGYRMSADTNNMLKVFGQLTSLTTAVTVTRMAPTATGATLVGTATGSEGQDAKGNTIPPTPVTLVFEFLDTKGAVVATQEAAVPALQPSAKFDINVTATGAGIVSWRYHVK
ncbi:MAG TPA: tetratricopeptide repeat protein [Gemmatimonadales bacterium]|jgi:tetratricopeptide (TPR) repeat protein|nr:tetratricopeptide repeat protein [Gemmatimonadales bacterium]